jgi:glycerophosphoryl diester phosphodiesterase
VTFRSKIVAHRGASHEAPENTLAALRLGFAEGADAGECDIRLTRDGHAILLHNATTRRTTNAGRDLSAVASTLAELRALDAGAWKGSRWAGEKIPTLAEVLAVVPPGRRLLVEIKCGVEILPAVATAMAEGGTPTDALLLMSFDRVVTAEAKRRFPAVEVWQITEWRRGLALDTLIAEALAGGLDGLDLDKRFPLDAAEVARVHAAGLKLGVWTVDDPALARRLAVAGVDAITTNRPGWLRSAL